MDDGKRDGLPLGVVGGGVVGGGVVELDAVEIDFELLGELVDAVEVLVGGVLDDHQSLFVIRDGHVQQLDLAGGSLLALDALTPDAICAGTSGLALVAPVLEHVDLRDEPERGVRAVQDGVELLLGLGAGLGLGGERVGVDLVRGGAGLGLGGEAGLEVAHLRVAEDDHRDEGRDGQEQDTPETCAAAVRVDVQIDVVGASRVVHEDLLQCVHASCVPRKCGGNDVPSDYRPPRTTAKGRSRSHMAI